LEALQEVFVGMSASYEREAFYIYNDYASKVGFSVRYSRTHNRCKSKEEELGMRQFYCWKEGFK